VASVTGTSVSFGSPPSTLNPTRRYVVAAYVATALLSLFAVTALMGLTKTSLRRPLYAHSDADFYSTLVKNIVENHSYYVNPNLGAPGVQQSYDFPQPHSTHLLLLQLLALFTSNYALVLNVYFLLTFPLIAVLALATFRQFGVSYPVGILGGTLYAFLPFHLFPGEGHLPYSSYFLVPVLSLVLLWILRGEAFFRWDVDGGQGWVTKKGGVSLLICVLMGGDTAYNAFFSVFFLVFTAVLARLRYARHRLRSTAVLTGTLLLVFGLNLVPTTLYQLRHGPNPDAVQRQVQEAEIYSLKLAQLVLPVTGHRIHALAALKERYNMNRLRFWINENDWTSLGAIGASGFLLLLGWLFFAGGKKSGFDLLDSLSWLNLAGFLLGTIGGFGVLFALVVSDDIRAYNRICAFLAFFSFFAALLVLERMSERLSRYLVYPLLALLLVGGLLDETVKTNAYDRRALWAENVSDEAFVHQLERLLPKNAMIFQLPYVAFPASPPVHNMADYDHFRAYLHSSSLRWSYGAMRGRDVDLWQRRVAALPPQEMAQTLALAGFSGIYVNRAGYADNAAQLENQLESVLQTEPLVSPNHRLMFFSLANVEQQLHERYPGPQWEAMHRGALSPLRLP
jgi:phosphoglycerol transferase